MSYGYPLYEWIGVRDVNIQATKLWSREGFA